jgi:hypothetical protein
MRRECGSADGPGAIPAGSASAGRTGCLIGAEMCGYNRGDTPDSGPAGERAAGPAPASARTGPSGLLSARGRRCRLRIPARSPDCPTVTRPAISRRQPSGDALPRPALGCPPRADPQSLGHRPRGISGAHRLSPGPDAPTSRCMAHGWTQQRGSCPRSAMRHPDGRAKARAHPDDMGRDRPRARGLAPRDRPTGSRSLVPDQFAPRGGFEPVLNFAAG